LWNPGMLLTVLNHFSSFSCSADLVCLSPAFSITLYLPNSFYLVIL
jgi:hypothetical protein